PMITVARMLMFCLPGLNKRARIPITAPKMMVPMMPPIVNSIGYPFLRGGGRLVDHLGTTAHRAQREHTTPSEVAGGCGRRLPPVHRRGDTAAVTHRPGPSPAAARTAPRPR